MSVIARQSTARTFMVGPVLDADGVAVTDIAVGDLKISKNGGVPAALNGSATLAHRHTGHYSLAATASDLDTVGQAEIVIDDATNAMPMKVITVIEEAVYDAMYAASAVGPLPADDDGAGLTEAGRLTALLAAKLAAHASAVLTMVVDAGSSGTEVVFKSVEGTTPSAVNDFYNGRVIVLTSGALAGQATSITDYVGATVTATVPALTGTPAEDVTAVIV